MNLKTVFLIALVMTTGWLDPAAQAQVRWWGVYDFRVQKGGEDSNPGQNNLPNDVLQFNAHHFQLFADAEVSDKISITGMLANNPASSFDLKQVELQLAYVSFNNLIGDALSLSAGKILTPFGSFARRQLASDNPLIGNPLFFDYALKMSPVTGYLDSAGIANAAAQYGGRLTGIYTGAYFVGVEASGSFFENVLAYDVALMNAPLSAVNGDYSVQNEVSFHGRVALHPAIWGTLGASYANGPFMQPSWVNGSFARQNGGLEQFKQTSFGMDLLLSYLYYELNAEYIFNRFDAPYITAQSAGVYGSQWSGRTSSHFDSNEFLLDAKIEAPFYPGLFIALRFDNLTFDAADGLNMQPAAYTTSAAAWDHGVNRFAVSLGYKPVRSLLIKLGYETTSVDVSPKPNLDVAACSLVVTF